MVWYRPADGSSRHASEIPEDTLQGNEDVGVDDDGDEEDGDAPAVGKAVSQVQSVASDPAPITADVAIGVLRETNST